MDTSTNNRFRKLNLLGAFNALLAAFNTGATHFIGEVFLPILPPLIGFVFFINFTLFD